jgi:hypothetical protein
MEAGYAKFSDGEDKILGQFHADERQAGQPAGFRFYYAQ